MMSKEPHKAAHPLNDMQKEFLRRYLKTGRAKESAILAGYSPASAKKTAADMLKNNLTIRGEVERQRSKGVEAAAGEYDLAAAMKEADEAIQIAKDDGNAAALATLIKLKAQMMKILDDRPQGANFQIMISGIDDGGQKTVISVQQPAAITGETNGDDQV